MSNEPDTTAALPTVEPTPETAVEQPTESFADLLADFEHTHSHTSQGASNQKLATVVSLDEEFVYLDFGYKTEGVLPRSAFQHAPTTPAVGDQMQVTSLGRNPEGYYDLSLVKVAQPTDWSSLQQAFAQQTSVAGTVTGSVKGGFTVDIGVRAFMPLSRSGERDAVGAEKLVGQAITCRILKLDTEEEDVVVDRRVVMEEIATTQLQQRLSGLNEGDILSGQVRSLTTYGAFIDLGGIDGLLHIGDIAWSRINAPGDVLSVGEQLQVKVLSVDPATRRISLGLKQLQPEPWAAAAETYQPGQRVQGTVSRLTDFGAFVELQPGIDGLIHVSEMSWVKKVRKPADMLKLGDTVDAIILSVSPADRRISLGLKQALDDPWADVAARFAPGTEVQGPVTRLMKFGAFVQLAERIEGLVHVSEIVPDRHIHHPQDVLRVGETVKALVLAVDTEKRQLKLSIKQLIPTGLAEFLLEHQVGDTVSGRIVELSTDSALVELGEGIRATCTLPLAPVPAAETTPSAPLDLSSLTSMLNTRWKTGASPAAAAQPDALAIGQVRSFRIATLDAPTKSLSLKLL